MSYNIDANRPRRRNDSTNGHVSNADITRHCPCNADHRIRRVDDPCGFYRRCHPFSGVWLDSILCNNVFHAKISVYKQVVN